MSFVPLRQDDETLLYQIVEDAEILRLGASFPPMVTLITKKDAVSKNLVAFFAASKLNLRDFKLLQVAFNLLGDFRDDRDIGDKSRILLEQCKERRKLINECGAEFIKAHGKPKAVEAFDSAIRLWETIHAWEDEGRLDLLLLLGNKLNTARNTRIYNATLASNP